MVQKKKKKKSADSEEVRRELRTQTPLLLRSTSPTELVPPVLPLCVLLSRTISLLYQKLLDVSDQLLVICLHVLLFLSFKSPHCHKSSCNNNDSRSSRDSRNNHLICPSLHFYHLLYVSISCFHQFHVFMRFTCRKNISCQRKICQTPKQQQTYRCTNPGHRLFVVTDSAAIISADTSCYFCAYVFLPSAHIVHLISEHIVIQLTAHTRAFLCISMLYV